MDRNECRDEHHEDAGGEQHSEAEGGGERDQELGLNGVLEHEGREADEGGEGSQHDGPEAALGALHDRRSRFGPLPEFPVDEVDHHQRIVDDDAAQAEEPHERLRADRDAEDQVAQDQADQPEGNHGHDDQRLGVGAKRNGEEHEDQDQGDRETPIQGVQGLELLLLFAPQAVAQLRVVVGQVGEDRLDQNLVGPAAGDDRRVHVRRDGHDPPTVAASDDGRRPDRDELGRPRQRNLGARRGAKQVVLDVGDGVPFVLRQPRVHRDLFPASLHAERLGAEEGGSRLRGQVVQREPEGARLGLEPELELRDAGSVVRTDVEHARHFPKTLDDGGGAGHEAVRIRMRQRDLDRIAEVDDLAAVGERANVGRDSGLFAPCLHDLARGDSPLARAQQLQFDGGDVGFRIERRRRVESAAFDPRALADGHRDAREEGRRVGGTVRVEPFDGAEPRRLDPAGRFGGAVRRRALGHLEGGRREVPFDGGGEGGVHDAGRHQGAAENEQPDRPRDGRLRLVRREAERAIEGAVDEPVEPGVDAAPYCGEETVEGPGRRPVRSRQVGQVVRQHKRRFDQGEQQHGDDDDRQRLPDVSVASRQEEQRHEGGHRREHGERERQGDSPGAANRRHDAGRSALAFLVDVLGDDDGVVDHDADGQDEREQGDRVDREVERQHDGQRSDARHAEAHGDPQGEPDLQEEAERDQHQQQAERPVLEEDVGPLLVRLGVVVPDGDAHTVRQRRDRLRLQVLANRPGDVHHLFVVRLEDLDEDRRSAPVPDDQVGVLEIVAHGRDVAETHQRAVAAAQEDDALEVLLVVALAQGAESHLAPLGVDLAGGQVQGAAANRVRDVRQREPERPQPAEGHLDGDLVVPHAAHLDLGDGGERRQVVLDPVRELLERAFGEVAVHDQAHHALAVRHLADQGALGAGREGPNPADRGLDVAQRGIHVGVGVHLDPNRRDAGRGDGLDRLDVVQPADLVLDLHHDRFLDLGRRGAGMGHRHLEVVERERRPRLSLEAGQRHQARGDDRPHQQVGGYAVVRHVGDRPGPFSVAAAAVRSHNPRLP